jgi:hypothetical protein
MDPDEISRSLNIAPLRATRVGERRLRPNGQELGGVYPYSHWFCDIAHETEAWLVESLDKHLDLLEPHTAFLKSFVSTGGEIYYFIGWFTTEVSGGETFDWELLQRLANLRISLSFDVYGDSSEKLETDKTDLPAC